MNNTSSNFSRWERQVIALAAVSQCASLVNSLANKGIADELSMTAAVNPLIELDPDDFHTIYPNINHFNLGLRTLQDVFSNEKMRENTDIVRYTLGMLALRAKLMSNAPMQTSIREQIKSVSPLKLTESDNDSEENAESWQSIQTYQLLARIYQQTISTLSLRIQVKGELENLRDEQLANKIRSLLFAGIRSAVLWHQLGGRRWGLILNRSKIKQTTSDIRRKLISSI